MDSAKAASLKSTAFCFQKDFVFHITIDFYLGSEGTTYNTKVISSPDLQGLVLRLNTQDNDECHFI